MRATIRQIAAEAGVSNVTVSNVLRGLGGRASEETRERVLAAAQKLNYIPVKPPTAQNRQVETRVVTLVPEHHDVRHYDLDLFTYQGVIEGARHYGYSVLTLVQNEAERDGHAPLRFLDRSSDGFIFTVSLQEQWARVLDVVAHNKVPCVVCYNREVPDGVAWVDVDNRAAMRAAVEHLAERGHERIAFVAGPPDNFDAAQRGREWTLAMNERGLSPAFVVQGARAGYLTDTAALDAATRLDITAAICFNDTLALALWDAAVAQGKSVPDDLSIIGMDNRAEAHERGLTSVAHSFADVGRLAMDAWIALTKGEKSVNCCKLAPVQLIQRDSVRVLNSTKTRARSSQISDFGLAPHARQTQI